MSDDEISAALRRWAEATDPGADPLDPVALRSAPAGVPIGGAGRGRRSRWLLAAAAVVVVAVGAGAVWAVAQDDADPGRVTTATDPEVTPPRGPARADLQVVVEATGVATELALPSVTLVGAADGPADATKALVEGTSLMWAEDVPVGSTWDLQYASYPCPEPGCLPAGPDGVPAPRPQPVTCAARFTVSAPAVRVLVRITGAAPDQPTCTASPTDEAPVLTVPPAFTLREPLPWTCGTGARVRSGFPAAGEQGAAVEAWRCALDAAERGDAVELPATDVLANDEVRPTWWRVAADGGVEVIRRLAAPDGGWSRRRCERLARITPAPPAGQVDVAAIGCGDGEVLPLDLPPLPTAPPTTADGVALVVVADDIPFGREGTIHRWVLDAGPVQLSGAVEGSRGRAETTLVATGIDPTSLAGATLRWEQYDCSGTCPTVGPDGAPVDDAEPLETCDAPVPAAADRVVVLRLTGTACAAEVADAVPALTVPPAWTLREPAPATCGTDWQAWIAEEGVEGGFGAMRVARTCLLDVFRSGGRAELASAEGDDGTVREVIWRVVDGEVVTVRPPLAPGEPWTQQTCTDLVEAPEPAFIEATGCGPHEEMSLAPPA